MLKRQGRSDVMQGDREECPVAGMGDDVTKPIRVHALIEALNQIPPQQEPEN